MLVAGEELKKCPFCGRNPKFWYWVDWNDSMPLKPIAYGRIYCNNCKVQIKENKDFLCPGEDNPGIVFNEIAETLIRRWNRRMESTENSDTASETVLLTKHYTGTAPSNLDKDGCVYWDKFIK